MRADGLGEDRRVDDAPGDPVRDGDPVGPADRLRAVCSRSGR
jgi:hypothetical protein